MLNFFMQFCWNIVITRTRFRPDISYNVFDVIIIYVSEIKSGRARGGKVRIKWNFGNSIDWYESDFSRVLVLVLVELIGDNFLTCYFSALLNETWRVIWLESLFVDNFVIVSHVFRMSFLYLLN